jgi:AcrR family transcriptional regulator
MTELQALQEPPTLSQEQQDTLEAVLTHPTKAKAAEALGVTRMTVYRRLKDPALVEAYAQARKDAIQDAFDSAASTTVAAMAVLYHIAHDFDVPPSVRVQAASKLVDVGLKSVELEELEERLEKLEAELLPGRNKYGY